MEQPPTLESDISPVIDEVLRKEEKERQANLDLAAFREGLRIAEYVKSVEAALGDLNPSKHVNIKGVDRIQDGEFRGQYMVRFTAGGEEREQRVDLPE